MRTQTRPSSFRATREKQLVASTGRKDTFGSGFSPACKQAGAGESCNISSLSLPKLAWQDLCRAVLGLSLQGGEAQNMLEGNGSDMRRTSSGEAAAHVLLVQFGSCEALCLVEIAPDVGTSVFRAARFRHDEMLTVDSEAGVLVCRFRRFLAQFGNMRPDWKIRKYS